MKGPVLPADSPGACKEGVGGIGGVKPLAAGAARSGPPLQRGVCFALGFLGETRRYSFFDTGEKQQIRGGLPQSCRRNGGQTPPTAKGQCALNCPLTSALLS